MHDPSRHPQAASADAKREPISPASGIDTISFVNDTDRPAGGRDDSPALNRGRIDDFELLELIARGGMGVVYKARQVSMNRVVALKVIRDGELAADAAVERFCLEAQTAGQFDHPGIVPVYAWGQSGGETYYAMAYVAGESLAARIAQSPLEPREAAEMLVRVADALRFAHERGVIHRDLKPGNILLDAAGNPRLTDFGLARRLDIPQQLTLTGQVLGTPSYMPPEQARGEVDKVDARSDVYSLGAVLYAVLTGRPPFQGATIPETLRLVHETEPVPPRRLNPAIDRDLETICLKCLEKQPDARYFTVAAVQEELQRYLASQPIQARPATPVQRWWKWARRHPQVAGLLAVVALLLVAGAIGAIAAYRQVVAQRDLARRNELKATAAAAETVEALKFVVFDVHERLETQPGTERLRDQLVRDVVPWYEKLGQEYENLPEAQRVLVKIYLDSGQLYSDLGDSDKAEASFERAMAIGRELAAENPEEGALQLPLLLATQQLAAIKVARGEIAAARELYESVASQADRLPEDQVAVVELKYTNAYHLGLLARAQGNHEESLDRFLQCLQFALELESLGDSGVAELKFHSRMGVADQLTVLGRLDEALSQARLAIETLKSVADDQPTNIHVTKLLAGALITLGRIHHARQELPAAREQFERSVVIWRRLATESPDNLEFQRQFATALNSFGLVQGALGESLQGRATLVEALEVLQRLLETDPHRFEYSFDYVVTCHHLAEIDKSLFQAESAATWLAQGRPLLDAWPEEPIRETWQRLYAEIETYCERVAQCLEGRVALADVSDVEILGTTLLASAERRDVPRLMATSDRLLTVADAVEVAAYRYNVAYAHAAASQALAQATSAAEAPADVTDANREELENRAMGLLRQLESQGFFEVPGYENLLQTEDAWSELVGRADFQELRSAVAQ